MKISVLGAGNVGSLAAMHIAAANIGEVVLLDIIKGYARGKALDIEDSRYINGGGLRITGTSEMADTAGSDITVITAGLARKPGMTREDLLLKNAQIIKGLCTQIKQLSPKTILIIVTNPLDVMTYLALKTSGFGRRSVFGMGVSLDASRFANLIAKKLNVSTQEIKAEVIGSHGETMLPLSRLTTVKGKPLSEITEGGVAEELLESTRMRGKEIVGLLGSGSAFFAPSAAIAQIVKIIASGKNQVIGVSALLEGEYGINGVCIGVPCEIGPEGIIRIVKMPLNEKESASLKASAESIRELIKLLDQHV